MGIRFSHRTPVVLLLLYLAGCASPGGGGNQMQNTVYATHRQVQSLNNKLAPNVNRLNETTAELVARLDASNRETRRMVSVLEENQLKLEQLQRSLDGLTATLYRHLNLSPPTSIPKGPRAPEASGVEGGAITVQPPAEDLDVVEAPARTEVQPAPPELPGANDHYRRAQLMYANEEYALALEQFDLYLTMFPDTRHVANAQYWKAHCHFKMGDYANAVDEFGKLRERYPQSGKVPIAMHNQAIAYSRLDQIERAKALFEKLMAEFPDDVAAEGAREKLKQLQELE